MFWGSVLQRGSTLNLSDHSHKGDILHLSHINLNNLSSKGTTTVFLMSHGQKFPLAHLDSSTSSVNLDLYLNTTDGYVFSVQGEGQVSLLGYFPPR